MNIRTRLLLLVLAVWLPAAIAFGLQARATYVREAGAALQQIEEQARAANFIVERELDKRVVQAATLAASSAVRDGDMRRFHDEASAAVQGTDNWVFVVDKDRQLLNTRVPFDEMQPLRRPANAPLQSERPGVFFSPNGPVMKRPVIAVFAPSRGADGSLYNVGVAFEPAVVQSILDQYRYPEGALAAVMDGTHRVMARTRDPQKWIGTGATGDLRLRAEAGQAGFAASVTLDGVPSLTYLSPPNRYGWTIVIALPQAGLTAAAQRATVQALAASAALLLIGLGLALYAARRISQPVLQLSEAAAELGRGSVPPRLATGVAEADDVSAVLQDAGLRIRSATQTLEERVADAVRQAEEAQARLLEAQKHEAIGRLTGGIAHDFNNLLQTISTGLQVIERAPLEGRHARVLQSAKRATAKAGDLIRQMLTFRRSPALQPRAVDLNDLLLKSQELTAKAAGERITLSAAVDPHLPPLFVDPVQLELALLNLVFNARDAMPDGGRVVVAARRATPQQAAPLGGGAFVCLEVADDGPGMPPDVRSRAFDPYFTTKPIGAGSGLGLSQVLALARQSGGNASIDSAPGAGTRVTLLLPVADAAPVEAAPAAPVSGPGEPPRPLTVLMVEDDALVASVVVAALEAAGHRVELCATADDAMAALSGERAFDVLFTDVVMPGRMTGLDLIAWCRLHRPGLPAVVASGYSAQQADGDVTVIAKPYEIEALLAALQQAARASLAR